MRPGFHGSCQGFGCCCSHESCVCVFSLWKSKNNAGSNPIRVGLEPHKSQVSWDGIGFAGKKLLDFSCTLRKTNMTSLNITISFRRYIHLHCRCFFPLSFVCFRGGGSKNPRRPLLKYRCQVLPDFQGTWRVIPVDGSVINNNDDRFRPRKHRVVGPLPNGRTSWLRNR